MSMKHTKNQKSVPNPKKEDASPVLSALAINLRALRKAKGWSQADLASRIGVHLTHVSRVELKMYLPSVDFVVKAADAFGVSVDGLLKSQEDGLQEVKIEDLELGERLRLLEKLEKPERDALITVIDSMLTKHRIRQFLEEKPIVVYP